MRERSTWNLKEIAKKAAAKKAAEVAGDIYSMNQDHPQPAMDEYVIGDPSDFAEDVHQPNTWDAEYSGGEVKRNEIGMPEMRGDTFNHAEKTASEAVRLKKAELCVAVAKLMLTGKKIASSEVIEDQAYALMYMPDSELINTHKRLAAEQDESDDMDDDSDEAQDKQAGEIPPQFKENIEKMKAKSEGKSDDKSDEKSEDQGEKKEAGQMPDFIKEKIEEKKDDKSDDKAEGQQAKEAQEQSQDDQGAEQSQDKQATQQFAQMQQMMSQLQQMLQQAQQVQQAPVQAPAMSQGDELDQMLASDSCGPMAEVDIEMEPSPMDVDQVVLAGEDEILRSLFADDQQVEDEQVQEKQAAVRTASTRTVGTVPTQGVSKLGGSVSKTASAAQADNLSSLWATAPDVREHFGLK
jgi:hypothetical protein